MVEKRECGNYYSPSNLPVGRQLVRSQVAGPMPYTDMKAYWEKLMSEKNPHEKIYMKRNEKDIKGVK